jgi:hypothetical protein
VKPSVKRDVRRFVLTGRKPMTPAQQLESAHRHNMRRLEIRFNDLQRRTEGVIEQEFDFLDACLDSAEWRIRWNSKAPGSFYHSRASRDRIFQKIMADLEGL